MKNVYAPMQQSPASMLHAAPIRRWCRSHRSRFSHRGRPSLFLYPVAMVHFATTAMAESTTATANSSVTVKGGAAEYWVEPWLSAT